MPVYIGDIGLRYIGMRRRYRNKEPFLSCSKSQISDVICEAGGRRYRRKWNRGEGRRWDLPAPCLVPSVLSCHLTHNIIAPPASSTREKLPHSVLTFYYWTALSPLSLYILSATTSLMLNPKAWISRIISTANWGARFVLISLLKALARFKNFKYQGVGDILNYCIGKDLRRCHWQFSLSCQYIV